MKKALSMVVFVFLIVVLGACQKENGGFLRHWSDGVSVQQLKADIEASEEIQEMESTYYVEDRPFYYVSHEEISRYTSPEEKTDFINTKVTVRNEYFEITASCVFNYTYDGDSWVLDDLSCSEKKITPVAAPSAQIIAQEVLENSEHWDDQLNYSNHPYFVYNGTRGAFRYRDIFDYLEVTECVLEENPTRARVYFQIDSPMVDIEGYYPLEYSESRLRWVFAPTTIDGRDYDDTMHITAYQADYDSLEGTYRTMFGGNTVIIKEIDPQAWTVTYFYEWIEEGLIEDHYYCIEETGSFNPISLQFSMEYYTYAMCYSYEDDCWYNISNWNGAVMKDGGMIRVG